jgi:hypothetical protein
MEALAGEISKDHNAGKLLPHPSQRVFATNDCVDESKTEQQSKSKQNDPCVLFLIDTSSSLGGALDNTLQCVGQALKNMPPHSKGGVRIYGEAESEMDNCANTALLVPLQDYDQRQNMRPLYEQFYTNGRQVGQKDAIDRGLKSSCELDLSAQDGAKTIIVISDCGNSEDNDPGLIINQENSKGKNISVDVIDLEFTQLYDKFKSEREFRSLAHRSGGTFSKIANDEQFSQKLQEAIDSAVAQALKKENSQANDAAK